VTSNDSGELGTAVCGEGTAAVDPLAPPDDPDAEARSCFRCCIVWKPHKEGWPWVDACRPPDGTVGKRKGGWSKGGGNGGKGNGSGGGGGGGGGGGCFPGDATVVVEKSGAHGPTRTPLRNLKIGDRVLSAGLDGKLTYETVYFFGHQLADAAGEFVRLEVVVEEEEREEQRQQRRERLALELTPKHLLPVFSDAGSSGGATYTRAADVRPGDKVMVVVTGGGGAARLAVVAATSVGPGAGAFAPLTTGGGRIVVDGVVASVHSDWILDTLFEALGAVDKLHSAYEATYGAVLKAVFAVLGPRATARLAPLVAGLAAADSAQLAAGVRALLFGGGGGGVASSLAS
jgi:hypothetical protein